jgi:hypothetical protein
LFAATLLLITACAASPPDRRPQVTQLTQQIRALPGVESASNTVGNDAQTGPSYFEVDVQVAEDISADQLAAVVARYVDNLRDVDYTGYQAELDIRRGSSVFTVDGDGRPLSNVDQILAQARDFSALGRQFPGSTVTLHASISHGPPPATNRPSAVTVELADPADYTTVAGAVAAVAAGFPGLSAGFVSISSGKEQPAEIRWSRRGPTAQEIDAWNTLNADQSIPHAVVMTINGAVTGPLHISERIAPDDTNLALQLAEKHLPIVARLPHPVLYTASNQYQGHLGFNGQAMSPVAVLVGGCMARGYQPPPAEQVLINRYENCRR